MSAAPDPVELAPTRDPTAYQHRPLLSGGFWVMIVFSLLCLLAAAVVVMFGPRITALKRAANTVNGASVTAPAPSRPLTAITPAAPPPVTVEPGLAARVQRLEGGQSRLLDAAAAALAASALSDAAAKPAPFAAELAAVERLTPDSPDALALTGLAQQGAPTRAALAVELSGLAAAASTAARAPGPDASFFDRSLYAVSRIVSIRRVDPRASGADAILARAQTRADDGDLEGAVALLDTLPTDARAQLIGWRDKAERRIDIDRRIASLRAQAMASLAQAKAATP